MKGENTVCKTCGREFIKKMFTQVYCSQLCSSRGGTLSSGKRKRENTFRIMLRDGFKCIYCGKSSIEQDARLVLDHLIPISKGGTTTDDNLVTCCTHCNCEKGGEMLPKEVIDRIKGITKEIWRLKLLKQSQPMKYKYDKLTNTLRQLPEMDKPRAYDSEEIQEPTH